MVAQIPVENEQPGALFLEGESRPVVVVTGGSAGVGRATARAFAEKGASVAILARGQAGLDAAVKEIDAAGEGECAGFQVDVSDYDAVRDAAGRIEETLGPIDIWVNNAMVSVFSPVKEMQPSEYRRVTEVNYLGYVHGTLVALELMTPRDRGTIIQVGSALSYRGIPLQSAYCATKHAIQGFNDSLRAELRHDRSNIRVSSVDLPGLNTPQFLWSKSRMPFRAQPVPPIYEPEVAARAILWLSTHHERELNVGWPTVVTKLGNVIAPGLLDRYLGRTGYDSQMTDEVEPLDRASNLWEPLEQDFGTRGPFTQRAHDKSAQLWVATHTSRLMRNAVAVAAVFGSAVAVLSICRKLAGALTHRGGFSQVKQDC
ncbi:MAG: SDR family oxidoreductase [Dehalococcoidia bacterium]